MPNGVLYSQLRGEYWVTGDEVILCDDSIIWNAPCHHMVVVSHATEIIKDAAQSCSHLALNAILDSALSSSDVTQRRYDLAEIIDRAHRNGDVTDEAYSDTYKWIAETLDIAEGDVIAAFDATASQDIREYAIEKWNWIRIRQADICIKSIN